MWDNQVDHQLPRIRSSKGVMLLPKMFKLYLFGIVKLTFIHVKVLGRLLPRLKQHTLPPNTVQKLCPERLNWPGKLVGTLSLANWDL